MLELNESATRQDAEIWLRQLVREFGPGFHPDTPPCEYVDAKGRTLSDKDAEILSRSLDRVFRVLGDEAPYEISVEEARRMLRPS